MTKGGAFKPKGEFETTGEYETRQTRLSQAVLFGKMHPADRFAFVLTREWYTALYDADTSDLKIALPRLEELDGFRGLVLTERRAKLTPYVGVNAIGVSRVIQHLRYDSFGLAIRDDDWLSKKYAQETFSKPTFVVHVERSAALEMKEHMAIIIVGSLRTPWMLESHDGHSPTITDPFKTEVNRFRLAVQPDALWLYNDRTGRVYLRLNPDTSDSELRIEPDKE